MSVSRKKAQIAFEAISIEGGLISPEWLNKIAHLKAGQQSESDYKIHKGLNIRDVIGQYWRMAQASWELFQLGCTQSGNESAATNKFLSDLFRQILGFESYAPAEPKQIDERIYPITSEANNGRVPIVIAPSSMDLDESSVQFGYEGKRRSAFGLVQEYLNASDECLWGIATNGLSVRLLRDNSSFTRPAWIEIDLARIFADNLFSEFVALWLLLHSTRFGDDKTESDECPLEIYRNNSLQEGVRARDHLRQGVEEALESLGQGFLAHHENTQLKSALEEGALSVQGYYQELLRTVYRMIFLLTVEERGLLHSSKASETAKKLYHEGYSLRRLRDRCVRRLAHDRFSDLWESLKIAFKALERGEDRLGLPPLGGLFAVDQCPYLGKAKIQNHFLLTAIFRLSWLKEHSTLNRVNWRDMGTEELGSVYEGLLELVPQITQGGRQFSFIKGQEAKGNARKLTGSYYTPDSLVQSLLDTALDPVVTETINKNPADPVSALLNLRIIDPACGSGHFLLAAARRVATQIARLQAEGAPSPQDYRNALRKVIGRCVFGVDKNPMALELARTALWLEAITPDAPLTFVDHHLVCGDALVGLMDLGVLSEGIPNEAYKALSGDDKDVAKRLAAENRAQLKSREKSTGVQAQLGFMNISNNSIDQLKSIDELPDNTPEEIQIKRLALEKALKEEGDVESNPLKIAADMFLTAFLAPKVPQNENLIPLSKDIFGVLNEQKPNEKMVRFVRETVDRVPVLHWHLKFAQIFAKGGFDVVLGNPPWEVQQLSEEEFFSSRDSTIAELSGDARKRTIEGLKEDNPNLWLEFEKALFAYASANSFFRNSERFALTAKGKLNTYPLFSETALSLMSRSGRVGIIVPSGIATDDSTKLFFGYISDGRLVRLIDFENREGIFSGVHRSYKFSLMTLGHSAEATYSFFLTNTSQIKDSRRQFKLSASDISRINPNTRTCAIFRSQKDAELTKKIYSRVPVLWDETREDGNPWGLEFRQGLFNMTSDSHLFRTIDDKDELKDPVPLYEAKMIHHFDHRFATYSENGDDGTREVTAVEKSDPDFMITPRYWVERDEVERRLSEKDWKYNWLMGWRDICRSTDERTVIASVIPRVGVGNSLPLLYPQKGVSANKLICLLANWSSLVCDFVARHKVGGTHLNFFLAKQLPILSLNQLSAENEQFIVPRVLSLVADNSDMKHIAEDCGYRIENINQNKKSVSECRAELEAYFAAFYGLSREDLRYVLDPSDVMGEDYPSETFRVLKNREIREYGEFRTRRLVLEAWDRLEKSGELPGRHVGPVPLPDIPVTMPSLPQDEEIALLVWAIVLANGGAISRMDLARAFAIRSDDQLLVRLASAEISATARNWAQRVGRRASQAGQLAAVINALIARNGVSLTTDSSSRSTVRITDHTPTEDKIDPWYQFEARLALAVLRSQPVDNLASIDTALTGADRKLLAEVV